MATKVLITIFTLILIINLSHEASTEKKGCSPGYFVKTEECCPGIPKLSSKEDYKFCVGQNTPGARKANDDGVMQAFRRYNGKRGGSAGSACLMMCVLKRRGFAENNKIDTDKIIKTWVNNSTSEFKSIINTGVDTCKSQLSKINTNALNISSETKENCDVANVMFLVCVKHYLYINCPKLSTKASKKNGKDICTVKQGQLKSCDPLYVKGNKVQYLKKLKLRGKNAKKARKQTAETKKPPPANNKVPVNTKKAG